MTTRRFVPASTLLAWLGDRDAQRAVLRITETTTDGELNVAYERVFASVRAFQKEIAPDSLESESWRPEGVYAYLLGLRTEKQLCRKAWTT